TLGEHVLLALVQQRELADLLEVPGKSTLRGDGGDGGNARHGLSPLLKYARGRSIQRFAHRFVHTLPLWSGFVQTYTRSRILINCLISFGKLLWNCSHSPVAGCLRPRLA